MGIYAFFNPLEVYLGTIMYIEFHNIIQTDCKVHAIDLVKSSIVHIHTECATYIEIIPITKAPHVTTYNTQTTLCLIAQPKEMLAWRCSLVESLVPQVFATS